MARSHTLTRFLIIGYGILLAAGSAHAKPPAPDLAAGRAIYEKSCARCHGPQGQGDGPDAPRLYPKPRNLTLGVYKLRSTASGTPPTDDDIFHTLTHGLPGTRMPDWGRLDEATRWQLVYYLKSLAPIFAETPPQPVALPPDPGPKRANLVKGAQVYKDLGCAQCHGAAGRGNGPSSATLQDDAGDPIVAADLTQGWNFRGGSTPRDIALRLLTGIDGTPMPSYAEAVPAEDAWHLAYYVQSLQPAAQWRDYITVVRVPELPATAADPRWDNAPRTDVRLGGLVYANGTVVPTAVTAVTVQAVHDGTEMAWRLMWHDRTDTREAPADAFAVVLRPPTIHGDVLSLQAWPAPEAPALDTLVWSAAAQRTTEAIGFDFADAAGASCPSEAAYEDGQWTLVIRRALQPLEVPGAITLTKDAPVPVAFAAWDGGRQEQGRRRAVSYWLTLQIQP